MGSWGNEHTRKLPPFDYRPATCFSWLCLVSFHHECNKSLCQHTILKCVEKTSLLKIIPRGAMIPFTTIPGFASVWGGGCGRNGRKWTGVVQSSEIGDINCEPSSPALLVPWQSHYRLTFTQGWLSSDHCAQLFSKPDHICSSQIPYKPGIIIIIPTWKMGEMKLREVK